MGDAGLMYYTIGQRGGLGIGGQTAVTMPLVRCRKRFDQISSMSAKVSIMIRSCQQA